MNIRNIIGLIQLYDISDTDEMNPLRVMFISKSGSVYDTHDGKLVLRNQISVRKLFGVTGKKVLDNIDDGIVRFNVNLKGKDYVTVGVVDMDVVGLELDKKLNKKDDD